MNVLKDFTLARGPDQEELSWSFRFGKCDGFSQTLEAVKSIPLSERAYQPKQGHLWTVTANPKNAFALRVAFENFDASREIALSQIALPGF